VSECVEHKFGRAALSKYCEGNDIDNKEYDVADATSSFQGIQQLSEPDIQYKYDNNEEPHNHGRVPTLRLIVIDVEDNQGSYYICQNGRPSRGSEYPCRNGKPA
jgi:hypothetical protein